MENRYRYEVEQSHFEEGNEQQMIISCYVTITCEAGGYYEFYCCTTFLGFIVNTQLEHMGVKQLTSTIWLWWIPKLQVAFMTRKMMRFSMSGLHLYLVSVISRWCVQGKVLVCISCINQHNIFNNIRCYYTLVHAWFSKVIYLVNYIKSSAIYH